MSATTTAAPPRGPGRARPARADAHPVTVTEALDRLDRRHPPRYVVVDVTVLVACLALAVLPLVPVYGPAAVTPPVVGGLLLGTAVALAGARWRWSVLVTAAVTVLVHLLAGGPLAAPSTTVRGVLPTTDSFAALLTGAVTVWKEVLTLDPSLGGSGNLLVAPFLLTLVGAVIAVSVAVRTATDPATRPRGVWAAVVPLLVLVVSVLLGTSETVAAVPAGTVTALLLLLWAAWRRGTLAPRRPVALVLMVAVLAAGGAGAGPWLGEQRPRLVVRDELVPPFDPRDQASPLSSFRRFVNEWREEDLLTVRGLPEGATVRLATMDAFDGVVWDVAGADAADGSGAFRRVGDSISAVPRGERARVEVEVHRLPSVWLPTVGYAERFTFAGGSRDVVDQLRYNDATGTAVLTGGVPQGTTVGLDVVVPEVADDEEIGAASVGRVRLPEPRRVPEAVPLFASELAGTAATPVLVARSLEQGLRDRGYVSHGRTNEAPSLSGHGANRVTTLLTADLMVGDGEQYASAMALLAREMGLPARVVMGFVPDEEQAGASEITFTGEDVQAWVEVSFAGHGWVPFFPTPDETKTPNAQTPEQRDDPQPQVAQPPPPPPDPVQPPDDDTEQPRTEDTEEVLDRDEGWQRVLLTVAAVAVPLVLLALPFVLVAAAKARRRRRRRRAAAPVDRVVGGWDEVLDHARDLRRPVPTTATRREAAVHLSRAFAAPEGRRSALAAEGRRARRGQRGEAPVGGAVAALALGADAMVFGRGEPADAEVEAYWQQVDQAVAALHASVPRRHRWRGRWSTASLRARRRARTAARRAGRERLS